VTLRTCRSCGWVGTLGDALGPFQRCPSCFEPTRDPVDPQAVDGAKLLRDLFAVPRGLG
jgi:hypothetical protein